MITAASRAAERSQRVVQRLAAMAKSIANAAFMNRSQRKGSCTKRNLGKCCQSKLLAGSMRSALPAPQAESSIPGICSEIASLALGSPGQPRAGPEPVEGAAVRARHVRENKMANARTPISARATDETRRLKRL